jgi:hypothetical protein
MALPGGEDLHRDHHQGHERPAGMSKRIVSASRSIRPRCC